jgi:hypothetical protein
MIKIDGNEHRHERGVEQLDPKRDEAGIVQNCHGNPSALLPMYESWLSGSFHPISWTPPSVGERQDLNRRIVGDLEMDEVREAPKANPTQFVESCRPSIRIFLDLVKRGIDSGDEPFGGPFGSPRIPSHCFHKFW